VFLGLNGVVLKSHGSADAKGVANAVHLCAELVEKDITRQVTEDLANFRSDAAA
jgi:glycerol-3-phosphate acyltransferase PlsX